MLLLGRRVLEVQGQAGCVVLMPPKGTSVATWPVALVQFLKWVFPLIREHASFERRVITTGETDSS